MEDLENLTNGTFNDLFNIYCSNTETYNHYELALELAKASTGYGTILELLETADLVEYTGFDFDETVNDLETPDFEYDNFLLQEVADTYTAQLNDGLSTIDLKSLAYFEELYYDFLVVTGYDGTKEDFEQGLRRSVDFFNFVVDVSTED